MKNKQLTLISHALCPYVQRVAIVLMEKNIAFERRTVDLAHKPDWFLKMSPLGKTPVLQVDGVAIFESAVICEYLEDVYMPSMHPKDALQRARHRAWMEFGSATLNSIAGFYSATDAAALNIKRLDLKAKFQQLEDALTARQDPRTGPWFSGNEFCLVDAVFAPVFRYFDVFDGIADFGLFGDTPHVSAWRVALAARPSIRSAVTPDYPDLLRAFLYRRDTELSRLMRAKESA